MSVKVEQVRRRRLRRAVTAPPARPPRVTPPVPMPLEPSVLVELARPRRTRAWILVDALLAAAAALAVVGVVAEYRETQAHPEPTRRPAAVAGVQGD